MSFADLVLGNVYLITGVQDDPEGGVRMYIGPRYHGRYVVVTDETDIANLRRQWADESRKLFVSRDLVDPEAIHQEAPA